MLSRLVQEAGLGLYRGLARSGVLSRPIARRAFLKAYAVYKTLVEAGPVDGLKPYVLPGSVVIDVGANVGFFTLKFARWVGVAGRVLAIEPDGENYAALQQAIAKSRLQSRVEVHQAVAAGASGTLFLSRNEVHPGDHKIAIAGESGIEVPAVTVDSLIGDTMTGDAAPLVSLIKIDVQGAEMMVLAGAGRTLARHSPALFIEIDDQALRRFGSSADALVEFLHDLGYRMHQLRRNAPALPLDRSDLHAALGKRRYIDVLFVRRQP